VGSVPHSNHAVVDRPLAVTFPFRVAPVAPTDVADKVVAIRRRSGSEIRYRIPPRRFPTHYLPLCGSNRSSRGEAAQWKLTNWLVVPDPAACVEVLL